VARASIGRGGGGQSSSVNRHTHRAMGGTISATLLGLAVLLASGFAKLVYVGFSNQPSVPIASDIRQPMFISGLVWGRHLARFRNEKVTYLEIGSYVGESVSWMFEHILTHPQSRAICIDPWERYRTGASTMSPSLALFERNTAPFRHRIQAMRGKSREMVDHIPNDSVEIAYVDGDHFQWAALEDLVLVWPKLKVGGVLLIDDYAAKEDCVALPKRGVDAFLDVYSPFLEVLHKRNQVIARKRLAVWEQ
jgi:predicted O-methyltransferase YrrM